MSMHIKIIVAESSDIIRSGIVSVLRQMNFSRTEIFEVDEIERLKNVLNRQDVDILIINPLLLGVFSLPQIKKEITKKNIKYIALQNSLSNSAAFKIYDEIISLYDSLDEIKRKINNLVSEPEQDKNNESLTSREKEIVVCVIKGMTNKQIAEELCLSTHTVISHRRNIATKLQIHSTAGLTIYAIVNKLVELDDIKNQ